MEDRTESLMSDMCAQYPFVRDIVSSLDKIVDLKITRTFSSEMKQAKVDALVDEIHFHANASLLDAGQHGLLLAFICQKQPEVRVRIYQIVSYSV